MKSFDFKKSYEDIKINDREYRIDLSDDKVKEYRKAFVEFYDQSIIINQENEKEKDEDKMLERTKEIVGKAIDTILGEGSFSILYIESGKSLINMVDLVSFLTEIIKDKTEEFQAKHADKYLKKPKGKK